MADLNLSAASAPLIIVADKSRPPQCEEEVDQTGTCSSEKSGRTMYSDATSCRATAPEDSENISVASEDLAEGDNSMLCDLADIFDTQLPSFLKAMREDPEMFNRLIDDIQSYCGGEGTRRVEEEEDSDEWESEEELPSSFDINDKERDAIDRLMALGFSEELAMQAYYVCERNENAAANYLLSLTDEEFENEI